MGAGGGLGLRLPGAGVRRPARRRPRQQPLSAPPGAGEHDPRGDAAGHTRQVLQGGAARARVQRRAAVHRRAGEGGERGLRHEGGAQDGGGGGRYDVCIMCFCA